MGPRRLTVDPGACLWGALVLLLVPLPWAAAWAAAALLHELSHAAAVALCGKRIVSVSVGPGGAVLETDPLSGPETLFCALAGPAGNLLTLLLAHRMPRLAVCALGQALWNLLPLYPLDGGRALRAVLSLVLPPKAWEPVCRAVQRLLLLTATGGALFLRIRSIGGSFPLLAAGLLWLRAEKHLANFRPSVYNKGRSQT